MELIAVKFPITNNNNELNIDLQRTCKVTKLLSKNNVANFRAHYTALRPKTFYKASGSGLPTYYRNMNVMSIMYANVEWPHATSVQE